MKLAAFFGILGALFAHAVVLLFGGIFFLDDDEDQGTLREVELLSAEDTAEKKEEPAEEPRAQEEEELAAEEEEVPDAAEIIRNLDLSPLASAPALDAASLGAIESALSGLGGSGEFGDSLSFSSGGRIGGTGSADALGDTLGAAFDLTEIDQGPRAVFQPAPLYPATLRGKKVEGVAVVIFIVDATGKVQNPRIESSSHPAFERPAVDAIKQWKFEPAVRAGQRVGCKMRQPIRFQPGGGS